MISGAIGKLGETYTIDAKMFEVSTGAAEKTISSTYTGQLMAWLQKSDFSMEDSWIRSTKQAHKKRKGAVATMMKEERIDLASVSRL